jgi:hypothetical protein
MAKPRSGSAIGPVQIQHNGKKVSLFFIFVPVKPPEAILSDLVLA